MQPLRPYVWVKKNGSLYNAFFTIAIPDNFQSVGLQSPIDSTAACTRSYAYNIQAQSGASATTIDNYVGNHSQPTGITLIEIDVIDVTDPNNPVKKGSHISAYQNGDNMG
jgi:hypothetical protein